MFRLDNLAPSGKKRKRVGRGGSRGGTAGKGHKGQRARSGGKVRAGFEGGQMPLHRRLPKRGFNNARFKLKSETQVINLTRLDAAFNEGDAVNKESLVKKGLISAKKSKTSLIKILGEGALSKKLTVAAHAFSKSARDAIEKAGGQAQII